MKLAVIDVGSNAIKLLAGEFKDGSFSPLREERQVTGLGEFEQSDQTISDSAKKESIDLIHQWIEELKAAGIFEIMMAGTSVLRRAKNQFEFCFELHERTGRPLQVLTGREEALIVYKGVRWRDVEDQKPLLLIDLGGGSLEWIAGKGEMIDGIGSIPSGCLDLARECAGSQDWGSLDLDELLPPLRNKLQDIDPEFVGQSFEIVGSGGLIVKLYDLYLQVIYNKEDRDFSMVEWKLQEMEEFAEKLRDMGAEKLSNDFELKGEKADLIYPGLLYWIEVLKRINVNGIRISTAELKHGMMKTLREAMDNQIPHPPLGKAPMPG